MPTIATHSPPRRSLPSRRFAACFLVSLALLMPTGVLAADPKASMTLEAEAHRPLEAAADELQRRYGIVTTYEDPAYRYSGDLKVIEGKSLTSGKGKPKAIVVPAGTRFEVDLIPNDGPPLLTPMAMLGAAVQEHAATGQPGQFRVEQDGEIFQLIPEHVRNQTGTWTQVVPVLDTVIAIPAEWRSGAATLRLICDELSAQSGEIVRIGQVPVNLLTQTSVQSGGTDRARDYLAELVRSTAYPLSWRLDYDANLDAFYLSLAAVVPPSAAVLSPDPPEKGKLAPGGKG